MQNRRNASKFRKHLHYLTARAANAHNTIKYKNATNAHNAVKYKSTAKSSTAKEM